MEKRLRRPSPLRIIDQLSSGPLEIRTRDRIRRTTVDVAPTATRFRLLEMNRRRVQVFSVDGGPGGTDDLRSSCPRQVRR
ncbi:hypothetical protein GCM10018954_013120 [Kutzneria kofuensis]